MQTLRYHQIPSQQFPEKPPQVSPTTELLISQQILLLNLYDVSFGNTGTLQTALPFLSLHLPVSTSLSVHRSCSCSSASLLAGLCTLKTPNQDRCGKHTGKDRVVDETMAVATKSSAYLVSQLLRGQRKNEAHLLEDMHREILRISTGDFHTLRALTLDGKVLQSPIPFMSLHRILNIEIGA